MCLHLYILRNCDKSCHVCIILKVLTFLKYYSAFVLYSRACGTLFLSYFPYKVTTTAPPIPKLCCRPILALSTCLFPASPLNCMSINKRQMVVLPAPLQKVRVWWNTDPISFLATKFCDSKLMCANTQIILATPSSDVTSNYVRCLIEWYVISFYQTLKGASNTRLTLTTQWHTHRTHTHNIHVHYIQ